MALTALARRLLKTAMANGAASKEIADAVDLNTANIAAVSAVVVVTDATLTVTVASHANKTILLDSTHTQTVTLPQALGTGAGFRFVVGTKGTDGSKIIKVANATDIVAGVSLVANTDTTQVAGFATTATDDTATLNNTTKGGFVGDEVHVRDIKAGVFLVRIQGNATGAVVTPFSATV